MNLNNLGVVLLVFLMLVAMLASFIYYLRHWTQRQQRLANDIITEGQFFKRYVPTTLRVAYDARRQQQSERLRRHFNVLRIAMMAIAGGGLVAVVFFAVFENWSHIIQKRFRGINRISSESLYQNGPGAANIVQQII